MSNRLFAMTAVYTPVSSTLRLCTVLQMTFIFSEKRENSILRPQLQAAITLQ